MKFTDNLVTLATALALTGSAFALSCGSSGHTLTSDAILLRSDLAKNGDNERVSGTGTSQFDEVGTAKLQLRRVSGLPGGSTHVTASTVGIIVQNIINDCCGGQFCCGNDNVQGDQGDTVNVNVPC